MPSTESRERPDVELRLPADGAWVHVVRSTTAGLAARLDFTIDEIEDLRIAVGEACALVLPAAREAADLLCAFELKPGWIRIAIGAEVDDPPATDRESFAWQVLTTLASEASTAMIAGRFTVTLTLHSELAPTGG